MDKLKKIYVCAAVFLLVISLSLGGVLAYFSAIVTPDESAHFSLNIGELFGKLDANAGKDLVWGTDAHPYLISTNKHLANLYLLQNSTGSVALGTDTVFQVSDSAGNPCYIGGESISNPLVMPSIGNEDFPFISIIRGVVATGSNGLTSATLPDGKKSNTSVLGNIRIVKNETDQIDIGLFGVIGYGEDNVAGKTEVRGTVSDLLLSDIQVSGDAAGNIKPHTLASDYICADPNETNHIGILAGHAQNCLIENISVYYSEGAGGNAAVSAFDIGAENNRSYVSAGGILGYYRNIYISDRNLPFNSESRYESDSEGGNRLGSGTGIMFASDIWALLQSPAESSYIMQETFTTDNLYKDIEGNPVTVLENGKPVYFQKGVFTFTHSWQASDSDRIVKLWADGDDKSLDIAVNDNDYDYSYDTVGSTGYKLDKLTGAPALNNRVIIVAVSNGVKYVLTRSGTGNVQALELKTTTVSNAEYMIIPHDINGQPMLTTYTALIQAGQGNNPNAFNYGTASDPHFLSVVMNQGSWFSTSANQSGSIQLGGSFPDNVTLNSWTGGNALYFDTSALTFSNTGTGGTGIISGFLLYRLTTTGTIDTSDSIIEYAVPDGKAKNSYSLDENVLFYTGNPSASAATDKYKYELKNMKNDLRWRDESGRVIERADKSLFIADAVDYYQNVGQGDTRWKSFVNAKLGAYTANNGYFRAPKGAVSFEIQGTGITNDTAMVNIIVATNPKQMQNQVINCYRYNNYNIQNDTAYNAGAITALDEKIVLPQFPQSTATPMYVSDAGVGNGMYKKAYPNRDTLLIAYTFNIPCTATSYYFLAADQGSASFVYFNVERVASSGSNNPEHENKLFFNVLNGIDYVFSVTRNGVTQIANVSDTETDYYASLVAPYFGLITDNEEAPIDGNPTLIPCYSMHFYVLRRLEESKGVIYIYAEGATVSSTDYTDGSYITTANGYTQYAFADRVVIVLNQ